MMTMSEDSDQKNAMEREDDAMQTLRPCESVEWTDDAGGLAPSVPRSEWLALRSGRRDTRLEGVREVVVLAAEVLRALRGGLLLPDVHRPGAAALGAAVATAGHVAVVVGLQLAEAVGERVAAVALGGVLGAGDREALGRAAGDALGGGHVRVGERVASKGARGAVNRAAGRDPVAGGGRAGRRSGGGSRGRSHGGGDQNL